MERKLRASHERLIDEIMQEMEEFSRERKNSGVFLFGGNNEITETDARPFTPTLSSRKNSFVPSDKKPGKFHPSHMTNDRYYDTSHTRIGRAVIFNQRSISGQGLRVGTNKDSVDLTDVLENIGFEVSIHQDSNYNKIKKILLDRKL